MNCDSQKCVALKMGMNTDMFKPDGPADSTALLSNLDIDSVLEKFQLKLIKKIKEAIQFADKLVILSNDKKISRKKSELLNEIIKDLVTEDGPYMQPMLIDQLKYLYNMVSRADQILGKDAYNRFDELINQFERLKKIEKII